MLDEVRTDPMMASLLDRLDAGEDIGHYGRLVFAMVARHFANDDEVAGALQKDRDLDASAARALLEQVAAADYSPPKRDKILEFESRQSQPIVPNREDPDSGNVYKTLQFPERVYEHIAEYRHEKAVAED